MCVGVGVILLGLLNIIVACSCKGTTELQSMSSDICLARPRPVKEKIGQDVAWDFMMMKVGLLC